jgi:hypothetical protein
MKANYLLVYLGLLALLLVVALAGGWIQDGSQRMEFNTWVPAAVLIAAVLVRYYYLRRPNRRAREREAPDSAAPLQAADVPAAPVNVRRLLLLAVFAAAFVIFSWFCLIQLGKVGAGADSQTTALMGIRIVTSVITALTAVLLSRTASAAWANKRWVFYLVALSQVLLAFIGLMIVPLIALGIWNGHIDFQNYSHRPGFLFLLLPVAAVTFCLVRGSGSKK